MFELRWLTRKIDYTGISQGHAPDEETVLQFRTQVLNIGYGYGGAAHGGIHQYERPMGWSWTEWKDVPKEIAATTQAATSNRGA